jgi:hypothetical protein
MNLISYMQLHTIAYLRCYVTGCGDQPGQCGGGCQPGRDSPTTGASEEQSGCGCGLGLGQGSPAISEEQIGHGCGHGCGSPATGTLEDQTGHGCRQTRPPHQEACNISEAFAY